MFRLEFYISFVLLIFFNCSAAPLEFTGVTPCMSNDDCKHLINATCVQPTCMCDGKTNCTASVETVVTKIGENCTNTEECNIESSICERHHCVCKPGYVKSSNEKRCLLVSEGIEGKCEENVQCFTKIDNSICEENKCVCEEMHEFDGSCYKNVILGGFCKTHQECSISKFASCQNSTCTCQEGYVHSEENGVCLSVANGIKSPCLDGVQCTATLGEFSHCANSVCKCKELYHYKEKINKCVEDKLFGDTCVIHSDCHSPYPEKESRLECIAGECKCRSFYKEKNGICIDNHGSQISTSFCLLIVVYVFRIFL